MDDFGLLVGRHFTTLPTLSDEQLSELQLDSSGRLILAGRWLAGTDTWGAGDSGLSALAVRQDSEGALSGIADGEYTPLQVDSNGRLKVATVVSVEASDAEYAEDSTHTTGDTGLFVMGVRDDGTSATGTAQVVDYTSLSGDTFTIDGNVLTEGSEWTAATSNIATATSLASAIDALTGFSATSGGTDTVTITADPGSSGNVAISTSDGTNLSLSGSNLTGGADDTEFTDTNYDYSPFAVDKFGRIKVVADLDVDFDYIYAEDTAHNSGDLGAFQLSVRMDDVDGVNSALLAGTEGDYQAFFTNAKGELHVRDNDVFDQLVTIDSVLDNILTDTNAMVVDLAAIETELLDQGTTLDTIAGDTTSMDATLTALSKAEDSAHGSGDQGLQILAVRADADGSLVDTDGDYAPFQVDAAGNLKVVLKDSSVSITAPGSESYSVTDALAAAGDGLETITAAATPWVTVASLSVPAGQTAYVYGWQFACDQNCQARIMTDDTTDEIVYKTSVNSSAMPSIQEHFADNGRIEIPGAASLELRIEMKKRSSTGGNANGTGSLHVRLIS